MKTGSGEACPRHHTPRLIRNFGRIDKTLRFAPAMGPVLERLWEIADIAKLVEDAKAAQKASGPNGKRVA